MRWSRTARSVEKVICFFLSFCASRFIHALMMREDLRDNVPPQQRAPSYDKLDVFFKGTFIIGVPIILVISFHEEPVKAPLRLWIALYGVHCITYLVCVYIENQQQQRNLLPWRNFVKRLRFGKDFFYMIWMSLIFFSLARGSREPNSFKSAPILSSSCFLFLMFDFLIFAFSLGLLILVGVPLGCCLPVIYAISYAMGEQNQQVRHQHYSELVPCPFCQALPPRIIFRPVHPEQQPQ